jgi:hypothetical protein
MMRHWRQRAWIGAALAGLSGLGLTVCWRLHANGLWWFLSIAGEVSALIGISGDINAYHNTKKQVVEIEKELETHAL